MKKSSLIAALVIGSAFLAAPAVAKTSITKGRQICETAVKAQDPAPKSVRTDGDETRSYDATTVFTLKVTNADNSSSKLICTVDRETAAPTIKPAS